MPSAKFNGASKIMKIIKINALFVALCLFALGSIFIAGQVSALTVSPVRIEVAGNPGQTVKGNLVLLNDQTTPQKLYSSLANFESNGTTGVPVFTPATQGLGTWIKVPSEVDLQPGEQQNVPYEITIPSGASAGGNYAAIFWSPSPNAANSGQVAIGSRTGILVLLTVNGDITINGALSGFKANGGFFDSVPVNFQYTFGNAGNDRVVPQGSINIKNLGLWTSASLTANGAKGNVLPNSNRTFNVAWGSDNAKGFFAKVGKEWNNFHLGIYTADLSLSYGQDKLAVGSYTFFMLPWQLLLTLVIILLIVGFLVALVVKKWDKWIVRKASMK